jgi:hypothetical protein
LLVLLSFAIVTMPPVYVKIDIDCGYRTPAFRPVVASLL